MHDGSEDPPERLRTKRRLASNPWLLEDGTDAHKLLPGQRVEIKLFIPLTRENSAEAILKAHGAKEEDSRHDVDQIETIWNFDTTKTEAIVRELLDAGIASQEIELWRPFEELYERYGEDELRLRYGVLSA